MICAGEGAGWARTAVQGCTGTPHERAVDHSGLPVHPHLGFHLTGICACPGLRPSRVSTWLARVHTRVCMQACQQPGGSASLSEPAALGKLRYFNRLS